MVEHLGILHHRSVIAYRPADDTTRLITANTTSTLTVTTPWASAPQTGEEIYLGRIVASFTSKWIPTPEPEDKKRPERLAFSFVPSVAGSEFRVYQYADFVETSKIVTAISSDVNPAGVTIVDGESFQTISFATTDNQDGYVPAPTPSDYQRFWSVKMEYIKPKGTLKLYGYKMGVGSSREVNE